MKKLSLYIIVCCLMFIYEESFSQANMSNFGFGTEIGVMNGTIDGGNFSVGFNADYRLAENFSFAEILTLIPSADLFQMNLNTVARFNIPINYLNLIPYMGIGFSYGSIEKENVSENSLSIAFPIGVTVTYPIADQIAASVRTQIAIYNLDYGPLGEDKNYFEFMVGLRFAP
jgi:hypothetical protein